MSKLIKIIFFITSFHFLYYLKTYLQLILLLSKLIQFLSDLRIVGLQVLNLGVGRVQLLVRLPRLPQEKLVHAFKGVYKVPYPPGLEFQFLWTWGIKSSGIWQAERIRRLNRIQSDPGISNLSDPNPFLFKWLDEFINNITKNCYFLSLSLFYFSQLGFSDRIRITDLNFNITNQRRGLKT